MNLQAKVLVLTGDGINCERETARAFQLAGADPIIIHINDLLADRKQLDKYQILAFPGGFSFGDDLGSGQVLGLKLKYHLGDELRNFVEHNRPIIGICNGFQALVKLGLLPQPFTERVMSIAQNTNKNFMNRWVELEVDEKSPCIWTKYLGLKVEEKFELPIRHGEGRVHFTHGQEEIIHKQISENAQIPLRYKLDVNGSYGRIAGVCDPKGYIFGLMPHPEAAVSNYQHPRSTALANRSEAGLGLRIFTSCLKFLKES